MNSSRPPASRKKTSVAAPPIPASDIAHRAFELFAARGGEHGHDVDDWLRAEHELTSAAQPKRPSQPKRSTRRAIVD